MLLHDQEDFDDLLAVVSREQAIDPGLVEKDYWIMHALWGLQQLGFTFELKGGTSLSKGHGLIHRFSEDIDILIHPDVEDLPTGKNQTRSPTSRPAVPSMTVCRPRLRLPASMTLGVTKHSMTNACEAPRSAYDILPATHCQRVSRMGSFWKQVSTRWHPTGRA